MPTAHQVTESANKADSNNNENNNNEPSPPPRGSSVHLEGFADAIPSPMAVAPKASTNTASTQQPSSQSPSQKTSPSQKVAAARKASNSLIQNALLSSLESSYITLQSERDSLQSQLTEALNVVSSLKLENASLKSSHDTNLKSIEDQGRKWRGELSAERERREEMEKKLRWCEERCVRLEGEGDSLRGEISRLTKTNEQHTALITQIQTTSTFSTSQVLPLQLEITRLRQELDAVTSHSHQLESQLSIKSNALSESRTQHSREIRQLTSLSDERQYMLEQRDRELVSTKRHLELAQGEIDRLRNESHQKECAFIEQREKLEMDLNKERELVALKEQAVLLARDQRDGALNELKDVRLMAEEAAIREERMEREMEGRWRMEVENAVASVREEEEGKRVVLVDRLRVAEEEKKRLEEDVFNSPIRGRRSARMIASGSTALAITDGSSDGGLLSLTDLYTRLAETEDELRATQHENKKLKIIIDRIHRDVAAKTPIFLQKQMELENALEELEEQKERLDHARREVVDVRADNHDLELRNQQMIRECREMKRENHDLALQVQRLLQRGLPSGEEMEDDSVTFDSIQTLQEQNQKLLRDHHSMSEKIGELEGRINNNPDKIELDQLKVEVVSLREEREKQSKLVAGIVHQRDLYCALVAKNDAALIDSEAGNQLALVDAKAEQLPMLEAKNRELVEESAKLRADVSTFKYEKDALESRLARIDAHADELTASNERMRGELTAANATIARMEADVSHYRGRCERMEVSLDAMKDEKESEVSRRNRMEELNSKLQTHLDGARATLAKHQQQLESASSKVKMLEIQLENAKASEARITAEANELRAEIARQGALLGSVQRIEASLAARSEGERAHLESEVKRLSEKISTDEEKHLEDIKKFEGKVSELELSVKDLTAQKEAAAENAAKASNEVSQSKLKIQEITLKLKTAEKELTVAKRKLGDTTIDTSAEEALEAKVASLTSELEATKSELETSKERIANYQSIAKSSEEQLTEITTASSKYKKETEATLKRLQQSEQSQKEAVAELTKDLMEHRGEKEKAVNELKSKVESLTLQLTSAKKDASEAIARMETLNSEMKAYQNNASSATNNYERELALHAEARTALRDARSKSDEEQSLREAAVAALESRKAEFEAKEAAWRADKIKLEESSQQAKTRYEDLQKQNHLLHEQMTSLAEKVEKFQAERTSQLVGEKDDDGSADKQLSDMRELLQFKQSECVMLLADLASSKRTAERERTRADMAKKSLEEARSELKVLRESTKDGGNTGAPDKDTNELSNQLKTANDQLMLVRESNTMLREETQRLVKKLADLESECKELKTAASPNNKKLSDLEVEKAALEAEKTSLSREVDAWKNRVHSLVSKFNQIDPEEHAQALASIEKLKTEAVSLKSLKEKAEKDSASAKGLVARLNKEVSTQKSSIEAFKNALEKTKEEKEKLTKSAQSNLASNKKIVEAQAAMKKSEDALKAKTTELESEKARVESLKGILTKMKGQIKDAKDAEEKAKSDMVALQKQVDTLNQASSTQQETSATAMSEKKDETSLPAISQAEKADANEVAPIAQSTQAQPDPKAKKGKKRKGTPQKNAPSDPPLKKKPSAPAETTAPQSEAESAQAPPPAVPTSTAGSKPTSDDQKQKTPAAATNEALTAENNALSEKKTAPKVKPTEAKEGEGSKTKEDVTPTATDSKSAPQPKKSMPPKKMIKLTKASQAQTTETSKVATIAEKDDEEMKKKMLLLKKAKAPAATSPKEDATPASSTTGNKEEEMKKKMLLLKKRKAEMLMQAAAKKKMESETAAVASAPATASPKPSTVKPASSPKPLTSVPEDESMENNKLESQSAEKKESAPAPAPLTFGSSVATSGFGVPASMPAQSEPTCPKPSFFGASTTAPATVFGSSSTEPAPTGGPFLDLTPPGKAPTKPSQFVFGKSANITLPVPAPSPFGVFNQKTQATPFGSAFNINPPFGGGTSANSSPEKSADAEKVDDKTKEETDDGEVKEGSADKEGAKEA